MGNHTKNRNSQGLNWNYFYSSHKHLYILFFYKLVLSILMIMGGKLRFLSWKWIWLVDKGLACFPLLDGLWFDHSLSTYSKLVCINLSKLICVTFPQIDTLKANPFNSILYMWYLKSLFDTSCKTQVGERSRPFSVHPTFFFEAKSNQVHLMIRRRLREKLQFRSLLVYSA